MYLFNHSENSRMIYLLVLQFWLTVAANPVIRDLTIKNQWRQWRGRELRVTINSNLMIVMMPVQDPGPAHQRSGWCHGWAQTLTPVWRVITGRDWFCFYFCLICDLSGGCTGHTMPNCPRPVPAASRHQELNSGLRCEMWCVPCYRIWSSGRWWWCQSHNHNPDHTWHNPECRKLLMQGAPEILRKLPSTPGHLHLATCHTCGLLPPGSCAILISGYVKASTASISGL